MAACAAREDYSGAAVHRDAAQHLELQYRGLQLQQENEARTTVRHRLGMLPIEIPPRCINECTASAWQSFWRRQSVRFGNLG